MGGGCGRRFYAYRTQLIKMPGQKVAPVQLYSCPEILLYRHDYSRPCSLDQLCSIGAESWSNPAPPSYSINY